MSGFPGRCGFVPVANRDCLCFKNTLFQVRLLPSYHLNKPSKFIVNCFESDLSRLSRVSSTRRDNA